MEEKRSKRGHRPDDAVLQLERVFECQVADLETHCNVSRAGGIILSSFWGLAGYFETMVGRARGQVRRNTYF
ncbi:hypothetical protein [Hymenobacter agri]